MSNMQVLIYGVLESTNDWRSIYQGQWNFKNLLKYFTVAWPGSETRNKVSFNHIYW